MTYELSLMIYELSLTIYDLSLPTYELSLMDHELSIMTYELSLMTYELSLMIYELSLTTYRAMGSAFGLQSLGGCFRLGFKLVKPAIKPAITDVIAVAGAYFGRPMLLLLLLLMLLLLSLLLLLSFNMIRGLGGSIPWQLVAADASECRGPTPLAHPFALNGGAWGVPPLALGSIFWRS